MFDASTFSVPLKNLLGLSAAVARPSAGDIKVPIDNDQSAGAGPGNMVKALLFTLFLSTCGFVQDSALKESETPACRQNHHERCDKILQNLCEAQTQSDLGYCSIHHLQGLLKDSQTSFTCSEVLTCKIIFLPFLFSLFLSLDTI